MLLRKEDLRSNKSLLVYCYSSQSNFSTDENNFCWFLQSVQIQLQGVEFLIKFVFLYLRIRAEISKRLLKVSLNKGMLKCKIFIPTLSKLTRMCRCVLLWLHATQTDQTVHTDVFLPPTYPPQDNMSAQSDVYFPLF